MHKKNNGEFGMLENISYKNAAIAVGGALALYGAKKAYDIYTDPAVSIGRKLYQIYNKPWSSLLKEVEKKEFSIQGKLSVNAKNTPTADRWLLEPLEALPVLGRLVVLTQQVIHAAYRVLVPIERPHSYEDTDAHKVFANYEILKVHKPVETANVRFFEKMNPTITRRTVHQKTLLQQTCTGNTPIFGPKGTAARMLLIDSVQKGEEGEFNFKAVDLLRSTTHLIQKQLSKESPLESLKELIKKNGSAIVPIRCRIPTMSGRGFEEQYVVVDEVKDRTVRLRDPLIGNELTVVRSALESRLTGGNIFLPANRFRY